jgi:hypothetical protein
MIENITAAAATATTLHRQGFRRSPNCDETRACQRIDCLANGYGNHNYSAADFNETANVVLLKACLHPERSFHEQVLAG